MNTTGTILCCLLAAWCPPLFGQPNEPELQALSGNILLDDGNEATAAFDPEQWSGVIPLDLNEIASYWLVRQRLITDGQWQSLRKHIDTYGRLVSVYELQVVDGWDHATIRRVLEFVYVRNELKNPAPDPGKWIARGKQMLSLYWHQPFQIKSGFLQNDQKDRKYIGNTFRYQVSYRWQYEDQFKVGILLDHDPGEPLSLRKPADHIGFHLQVSNPLTFIKKIFLGDFRISLGQGIAGYGGYAGGLSDRVAAIRKTAPVIQVHRSSAETGFYRGVAVDLDISSNVDIQAWGFRQKADARLDSIAGIKTLLNTGLHRTASEIEARKSIMKEGVGSRIGFRSQKMGVSCYTQLTRRDAIEKFKNAKEVSGAEIIYGTDHYLYLGPATIFGEIVLDRAGNWSLLEGIQAGIGKKVSLALLYRQFQPEVKGEFGNPLSNQSSSQNEAGLLTIIEIMPNHRWNIAFHLDQWKQLQSTERDPWPVSGHSYGFRINYTKRHDWEAMVIYKAKHRTQSKSVEEVSLRKLTEEKSHRLRLYASKHIKKGVEWRIRAEYKIHEDDLGPQKGIFLATDLIWKPIGSRWTFTGRLALFDCPEYQSRIYAYENNLVYRGYTTPYYRTGKRFYLNTRFRPNSKLSLEWRFSHTAYAHTNEVGSGPDQTTGNVRSDYSLQIRYRIR